MLLDGIYSNCSPTCGQQLTVAKNQSNKIQQPTFDYSVAPVKAVGHPGLSVASVTNEDENCLLQFKHEEISSSNNHRYGQQNDSIQMSASFHPSLVSFTHSSVATCSRY
jgi:hypothetical protein